MHDDPKIFWLFTVKNGFVKTIGPAEPSRKEDLLQEDEDGEPFLRIPIPDPEVVKKIGEEIRKHYGANVRGEGTYDEATGDVVFTPERKQ
jgi:hypothetical protein